MTSIQKINNITFNGLGHRPSRNHIDPAYSQSEPKKIPLTPQEQYIDKRLKEQDANFQKALDRQNALIGSSLVAIVNYLNGHSDACTTRDLIQTKLIKKPEQRRIEI